MIKENQKVLNKMQMLLDILIVLVSFLLAYITKFIFLGGINSIGIRGYIITTVLSLLLYFILYNIVDLYSTKRTVNLYKVIKQIIIANIISISILAFTFFIVKLVNYSRTVLILFVIYNTILTSMSRIIIRYVLRRYRRNGYNQKHCLIIGLNESSIKLAENISKNKQWGYNIVGYLEEYNDKGNYRSNINKVLGNVNELENILENNCLDIVFIVLQEEEISKLRHIIRQCEKAGVKTNIVPHYYECFPSKPYMDDLDGIPIIETRCVPLDNYFNNACKRIFDIIFSILAILITFLIMLISVTLIKITSPGPIIYKQTRVGLNRKNFDMYKFRSMRVQEDKVERTQWTTKNDPRKTKWGSIIRKTSIDELPQFFNVLKGDMSIVGPRPERPFFVEKFKDEIPRYMIKHQVRPGITGWAQVNGYRGDTSIEKRIEHDLYYIENWTFLFDIKIIFLTLFKGIVNKNAY
ncbi:undecaprenyl-phosphate glucose phosphotransferase [Clostridioides sp. ZZV14-6345]|uniref:undecaprenyl-phosphate glucose phosphotransferase n=1 Tax=Clostridioides sp. ZZV14-6345 TaxID=2811496 RepID=UPI001D101615|nr:undecaprenyl-phosphate glucose phosphotransferase [Clostridioides sp. ZZV14-6345]